MRTHAPTALAATTLAIALAACGSSAKNAGSSLGSAAGAKSSTSASAAPKTSTTVGHGSGPTLNVGDQAGDGAQALLTAAGLLNKLPFPVKFADFTSGPPILQAESSGSIDIAQVGDAPPVFAASGGADIQLVSQVVNGPAASAILASKASKITSPSQLKGKRIAVTQGSSADYFLLDLLQKNHLTVHDVTLDYLQPAAATAALQSGSVDAWATWSPYIEQASANGAKVIADGSKYGSNYAYQVASKAAITNPAKAKEIKQYLAIVNKAHIWANSHPAAWGALWAKSTGLPAKVTIKGAKDDWEKPQPISGQTATAEQGLVSAFYKAGLIPQNYSFKKYVSTAFN
ncbi:MAG: aliphatic sulfonate ABC transporter substrate-binding protein [Solirubrobacterales bacterium]|nr:aliphatic sulfonate ABC transporter substrate-binding protein [Solirubrobacterales bacterium]